MTAMRKASRYASAIPENWLVRSFVSSPNSFSHLLIPTTQDNMIRLFHNVLFSRNVWWLNRINRMFIKRTGFGDRERRETAAAGWWVRRGVSFAGTWIVKFFVYTNIQKKYRKKEMIKDKRQRLRRRVISEETLTQLSYCCGWDDQL